MTPISHSGTLAPIFHGGTLATESNKHKFEHSCFESLTPPVYPWHVYSSEIILTADQTHNNIVKPTTKIKETRNLKIVFKNARDNEIHLLHELDAIKRRSFTLQGHRIIYTIEASDALYIIFLMIVTNLNQVLQNENQRSKRQ